MAKRKFYAYSVGKKAGIADNWSDCERLVSGEPGAKYKGFLTREEAKRWLDSGADYDIKHIASEKGIYFDSGTGAGYGVEINVTNEKGDSLLDRILPKTHINKRGHHWILKNVTNNFGELLACKYALQIALKSKVKKVFGDSNLVLESWSRGFIKTENKSPEVIRLVAEVADLREEFERGGGEMDHIPGASNPADLGFHK